MLTIIVMIIVHMLTGSFGLGLFRARSFRPFVLSINFGGFLAIKLLLILLFLKGASSIISLSLLQKWCNIVQRPV